MKPQLSPEHTATLQRILDELDAFTREMADPRSLDSSFHFGKLSTARADLAFVLDSTRRHAREDVVLQGGVRA